MKARAKRKDRIARDKGRAWSFVTVARLKKIRNVKRSKYESAAR
jgi:hypothetical protein